MKKALTVFAIVLSLGMTLALDAEARRMGGGRSTGMQRQTTSTPANTPPSQAQGAPTQGAPAAGTAAAAAPGAAAAAAPKRSWMGPVAGLAAGLGLAALASHLGFGEGLANMMMIGLLVMAVLMVVGFVMRKRAGAQGLAGAGAPNGAGNPFRQAQDPADRSAQPQGGSMIGSRLLGAGGASALATPTASTIPAGFDAAGFATNAKAQFLALQAANDAGDLDRLRDFLTPEMFEAVRTDIAERGDTPQRTEVFGLEAQVIAVAEEQSRYVASVRFTGSVRDQHGAVPEDLDEVWHLTKARSGLGGWVIAGIQQQAG